MIDSELSTQLLLRLDNDGRSIIPKESNDESLILYGIANDSHNFHLLNEEIKSWLDYPISKSISILNQTEHEFRSETNQQVFLVEVSEGWEQIALHNLEKLLRLWELQPPIDFSINRPIGRILRDFYRGINSGERIYCQSLLT